MPRQPRDVSAGVFHVYTHCVWATPYLFRDSVDRIELLRHLVRVTARVRWTCIAYCLMTSHYHLIVAVEEKALPRAMHGLNLPYALHYNRRNGLRGHVQSEPYGSRRIIDDSDLRKTFAYVVKNPVEAGLCASPQDWTWSSYRGTVGLAEPASFVDPARVLACFGDAGIDPKAALRAFVEAP
jgi:putative transposase